MDFSKILWLCILLTDVVSVVVLLFHTIQFILINVTNKYTSHIYVKDTINVKLNLRVVLANTLLIMAVLLSGGKNFINFFENVHLSFTSMVFFILGKIIFLIFLFIFHKILKSIRQYY